MCHCRKETGPHDSLLCMMFQETGSSGTRSQVWRAVVERMWDESLASCLVPANQRPHRGAVARSGKKERKEGRPGQGDGGFQTRGDASKQSEQEPPRTAQRGAELACRRWPLLWHRARQNGRQISAEKGPRKGQRVDRVLQRGLPAAQTLAKIPGGTLYHTLLRLCDFYSDCLYQRQRKWVYVHFIHPSFDSLHGTLSSGRILYNLRCKLALFSCEIMPTCIYCHLLRLTFIYNSLQMKTAPICMQTSVFSWTYFLSTLFAHNNSPTLPQRPSHVSDVVPALR